MERDFIQEEVAEREGDPSSDSEKEDKFKKAGQLASLRKSITKRPHLNQYDDLDEDLGKSDSAYENYMKQLQSASERVDSKKRIKKLRSSATLKARKASMLSNTGNDDEFKK